MMFTEQKRMMMLSCVTQTSRHHCAGILSHVTLGWTLNEPRPGSRLSLPRNRDPHCRSSFCSNQNPVSLICLTDSLMDGCNCFFLKTEWIATGCLDRVHTARSWSIRCKCLSCTSGIVWLGTRRFSDGIHGWANYGGYSSATCRV